MAVRKCPNCGAVMPAGSVAVYSYDLVCASCQHPVGNFGAQPELGGICRAGRWSDCMVDCYVAICRPAWSVGLGVAGGSGVSDGERGGCGDVNVCGQFGIKRRRSHTAERSGYLSSTSLISKADLFIHSYILRSRRDGGFPLFGRLRWNGTIHRIRGQARGSALSRGRFAAFDDRDAGVGYGQSDIRAGAFFVGRKRENDARGNSLCVRDPGG